MCFTFHQQRGHLETTPHLLSLAKDVKLGKYTVPTGNRTPGRRVAVHYATAAPRKPPNPTPTYLREKAQGYSALLAI